MAVNAWKAFQETTVKQAWLNVGQPLLEYSMLRPFMKIAVARENVTPSTDANVSMGFQETFVKLKTL